VLSRISSPTAVKQAETQLNEFPEANTSPNVSIEHSDVLMVPDNSLFRISKLINDVRPDIADGMVLLRQLSDRSNETNSRKGHNDDGIDPLKLLPLISRYFSEATDALLVIFNPEHPNKSSKRPVNRLFDTSSSVKDDKFMIPEGNVPLNELSKSLNALNFVIHVTHSGIRPVNWLFPKFNDVMYSP
jgi:hypothetical protein